MRFHNVNNSNYVLDFIKSRKVHNTECIDNIVLSAVQTNSHRTANILYE